MSCRLWCADRLGLEGGSLQESRGGFLLRTVVCHLCCLDCRTHFRRRSRCTLRRALQTLTSVELFAAHSLSLCHGQMTDCTVCNQVQVQVQCQHKHQLISTDTDVNFRRLNMARTGSSAPAITVARKVTSNRTAGRGCATLTQTDAWRNARSLTLQRPTWQCRQ